MSLKYTPATHVISNALILDEIILHAERQDLAQLCLVSKQTWQLAISRLWGRPLLQTIEQFEKFANSIGATLPFELRDYKCYGDLLCVLDLSMIARRWDKLSYDLLAPVFQHCSRAKNIDLSLCRSLLGYQFERLFTDNPQLCTSLTILDISETVAPSSSMEAVLSMLPGITTLCLNETDADDAMLKIISTTMPNLEWLEMDDCLHVTDIGLQDVADGCPKLAYLSANECWGILNTDLVEKINAKGGWEDLEGSQASEGYDYTDSDDYSFNDSDAYDDYDADDLDHVGF